MLKEMSLWNLLNFFIVGDIWMMDLFYINSNNTKFQSQFQVKSQYN